MILMKWIIKVWHNLCIICIISFIMCIFRHHLYCYFSPLAIEICRCVCNVQVMTGWHYRMLFCTMLSWEVSTICSFLLSVYTICIIFAMYDLNSKCTFNKAKIIQSLLFHNPNEIYDRNSYNPQATLQILSELLMTYSSFIRLWTYIWWWCLFSFLLNTIYKLFTRCKSPKLFTNYH